MAEILTLAEIRDAQPVRDQGRADQPRQADRRKTTQSAFLNAGRGNPNWIATDAARGFFLLGQFAITESKRVMDDPAGIGGMPQADGIAKRLDDWLAEHADMPGAAFLSDDGRTSR